MVAIDSQKILHTAANCHEIGIDDAVYVLLDLYGARAVTSLVSPRKMPDGKVFCPKLSANDCYSVLHEACRKMARVAIRTYEDRFSAEIGFGMALRFIFPDPIAYLARAIRSVLSDAGRTERQQAPTVSLDMPIAGSGELSLCLKDLIADTSIENQPEAALISSSDRLEFSSGLLNAFHELPDNYREALITDMERDRARERGEYQQPETDKERQVVCRARAAVHKILLKNCDLSNEYIQFLNRSRITKISGKKVMKTEWNAEKQEILFETLQNHYLSALHSESVEDSGEAIVNEVNGVSPRRSPSSRMRNGTRVVDTFSLNDSPQTTSMVAQKLYDSARDARYSGDLEGAVQQYRAAFVEDKTFYPAMVEAGVVLHQIGKLRDALQCFLVVLQDDDSGEERYLAATNAADIYLTWYDTGRNQEKNIENALSCARFAMQSPTPMRACNLILACVKDRYYQEAKQVLESVLGNNSNQCPADKFLITLAHLKDADLYSWYNWLCNEIGKDDQK